MTAKKVPDNEKAAPMEYEFREMPNLRMLRAHAAREAESAVVPEPEATSAPAVPAPAGRKS